MRDTLFKRYGGNPFPLLRTYDLKRVGDFILWLSKEQQDEMLRETWLHSQSGLNFPEWKKKSVKGSQPKRIKINKQKEQEALDNASRILGKSLGKGGDN